MSEPVKNAEVEDVLSSIRRLVSEDKRPLQTPQIENEAETFTDRLVLTPALRVAEPKTPQVQNNPQDAQQYGADSDADSNADNGADDLDAVLSSTFEDSAGEEPDTAPDNAPSGQDQPTADVADDPSEDYADDPYNFADDTDNDGEADDALLLTNPAMTWTQAASSDNIHDVQQGQDAAENTLSAKIAALETAIGDISDEWEPDDAGQDAYAGSEPETMAWEDDLTDTASSDTDTDTGTVAELAVDQPLVDEATSPSGQTIDAKAGDLDAGRPDLDALYAVNDAPAAVSDGHEDGHEVGQETAVEDQHESALKENSVDDGAVSGSEEADGWADGPNQHADAEDTPDASDRTATADASAAFAIAADDQLLDEDTLREMISEIVQQELQGALGARITRNVRRLVRREIHRALTARDLN